MRSFASWRSLMIMVIAPSAASAQANAPTRFELPNGLRVWVQEDHARPVALVQIAYKVGSLNEDAGATGAAHYVEHMVYRATERIRNEDIYGYIDRIGGRYTGGTSRDNTTYGETVPSWALEEALRTTAERMSRAVFDSLEFERERNNVLTEANGFARQDAVSAYRDALMLTSFELHPYRYTSTTWARDNLVLSRADAFEFYKRYYGPNNAVLVVVGDVQPEQVRRLVEKHFASLARAPRSGEVRIVEPPQRAEKRVLMRYAGARQFLDLVYRAPPAAHADYPVLVVLDRLLAARLRRALAPLGGVDVTTTHSATPYPHVYRVSIAADTAVASERLLVVTEQEVAKLRAESVSATEIDAVRAAIVPQGSGRGRGGGVQTDGTPPRRSSLTQIADGLTARERFAWEVSPETREAIQRAEAGVTSADVRAYADRWLRPTQRTVGQLLAGAEDYMPRWSTDRALAGTRLEIPALTTPPAKRQRPTPVPARALEPLQRLSIVTASAALSNGVDVRIGRLDSAPATVHARVVFPRQPARDDDAVALLAARFIASDSALQAIGARTSMATFANDGAFDIRVTAGAALPTALETIARALIPPRVVDSARLARIRVASPDVGGRGRGGAASSTDARNRVLRAVAPVWRLADPSAADLGRVSAANVSAYLAEHLVGGAVTVSIVAPGRPDVIEVAMRALQKLQSGQFDPGAVAHDIGVTGHAVADTTEERILVPSETQVTVAAGLPGVVRGSADARALELLSYIVGVPSYGGRLGWALTKVGLTYSSAATTTFGAATGHILFTTTCDTRNLDATIQAIREVIAGVAERGVEQWEVDEAKAFTLGRTLLYGPRGDSDENTIATALLDSRLSGPDRLDLPSWSRAYLGVTREQVNAAARRFYRPDRLKIVAIGAIPTGAHRSPFAPGTFRALFEP